MNTRVIIGLELRQLWRSPAVVCGLALLCAASFFAVHHGHTIIARQRAAIVASEALEQEQHRAVLTMQPRDANAGDQLYYLFFHTVHEPSPWAPLSLGQRDMQPFNLKIRLLALQGQLYDNDVVNPLLASFGSFDLTFVLVFVVPLFIIALTHSVWSSERELGTWGLIRSQPSSTLRVLALKLAIRTSAVVAPIALVMGVTAWTLKLAADARLAAALLLVAAYVVAWAGAALIVVAWKQSSSVSLLVLLGLWTVGCILGPALVNVVAGLRYPVPEALELTVRQRQGYHDAWDRPLAETMKRFYERYPEWRDTPVPADRYSNAWYYAMQQRGDIEAEAAVANYADTLARRTAWTRRALILCPPALLQSAMNAIARTDLESHTAYLESVGRYHEALKQYFFPVIFNDLSIGQVEWRGAPRHRFRDVQSVPLWVGRDGLSLGAVATLLVAAGSAALWRTRERSG